MAFRNKTIEMEKVLHQKIKKSENFFPLFILFKNQIFTLG